MRVNDRVQILARHVDRAVDHEAGVVHLVGRVVEDFSVAVDLDQVRCSDLFVQQSVRIDEKLILRARHAYRDVVVDHVRPAVMRDQPISGGELDARLPLLVADLLAARRHFMDFCDGHGALPKKFNVRQPDSLAAPYAALPPSFNWWAETIAPSSAPRRRPARRHGRSRPGSGPMRGPRRGMPPRWPATWRCPSARSPTARRHRSSP